MASVLTHSFRRPILTYDVNKKLFQGIKQTTLLLFASSQLAKRGKGYWKFSSQLLRDTDDIKRVKTCITESISEYYLSGDVEDHLNVRFSCNDQTFFEILKMKIKFISFTYSIKKSIEEKSIYRTLENDIKM